MIFSQTDLTRDFFLFRNLLLRAIRDLGFGHNLAPVNFSHQFNLNSGKWQVIKAALTAGLYPNIGVIRQNKIQTQ